MSKLQVPPRKLLLFLAPLAALAFLFADSAMRMRSLRLLTETRIAGGYELAEDPDSPSGYAANQHDQMVLEIGTDSYQWAMQTQQMLARGESRVRWVDYDGAPEGRAVHWASFLHWWTAGLAWTYSKLTGVPLARSVVKVYPWAATVCLGLFLVVAVPLVGRRFGLIASSLLAAGLVAFYPVYSTYTVGYFDHHGLVASCALLTVLCIVAGGGGWVRADSAASKRNGGNEPALAAWLLTAAEARRWFIASGVAAGAGLWISAATEVPTLLGIGVAVVGAMLLFGRASGETTLWHLEPAVWRAWGIAGAISSLFFFLLEYFPSHMSLRLEVNHPLYAVAFLCAGDLLCRLAGRFRGDASSRTDALMMAADVAGIAALPAIVVLVPASFVLRPGSLLMTVHEAYIGEFQSLAKQIGQWSWTQINAGIGTLKLLTIGPAIAICCTRRLPAPVRGLVMITLGPAVVLTLMALRQVRWLTIGSTLWLGTLVAIVTVATMGRQAWSGPVVRRIALGIALALPAAVLPMLNIHAQYRDAGVFNSASMIAPDAVSQFPESGALSEPLAAVLFVAMVFAALLPYLGLTREWNTKRLVFAGVFLGLVLLPFPTLAVYHGVMFGAYPPAANEMTQVVTRDISRKLRMRLGSERGVVATNPTATTLMVYFGGFRGLGTLYWENAKGLEVSAQLLGSYQHAPGESSEVVARRSIEAHGVTHIVLYSWDGFALTPGAGIENGFARQLVSDQVPRWLRRIPYVTAPIVGLDHAAVRIFEVVPEQSPEEAFVRAGQYYLAISDGNAALKNIQAALTIAPDFVPGLIQLARIQYNNPQTGSFAATEKRIRAQANAALKLEDNINLAAVYMLAGDTTQARTITARALAQADDYSLRHLPPDYSLVNFVALARQLNLAASRPEMVSFALSLLPREVQGQLGR